MPCGDNEQESGGACICVEGYARAGAGEASACEPIPEELGVACDTEGEGCADGAYPLCHVTDSTSGYCTKACSSSDECTGGYLCQLEGDDGYCRRPPVGYGDSCENDADCADGEATFCETIQSNQCLVACSAATASDCFVGEVCCSFVIFEPICVPAEACTPNGGIELGAPG